MTGKIVGVMACIKTVTNIFPSSYCILCGHALSVKRIPTLLKSLLDCLNDIGREYETLIFHA
jgi:hypothetical protein